MRCLVHPTRESSGYCAGCGNFFCTKCLVECVDGRSYCGRCRKKLSKSPNVEQTARAERLATRLNVKFKNGAEMQGVTYKIDPHRLGFNFIAHATKGTPEEMYVEFADVKYVALLGSAKEGLSATHEYMPKGSEIVVTFKDGEVFKGFTLKHYADSDPRFSVIPASSKGGMVSAIIERTAVANMSLGRIPKAQEMRSLIDNSVKRMIMHYYWQHPDVIITISELAARLEREPRVVDRELAEFIHEGLVSRIGADQLRFTVHKDHVVRETVASMGKEIDQLYFRKQKKSAPARPARPKSGALRWPL